MEPSELPGHCSLMHILISNQMVATHCIKNTHLVSSQNGEEIDFSDIEDGVPGLSTPETAPRHVTISFFFHQIFSQHTLSDCIHTKRVLQLYGLFQTSFVVKIITMKCKG